MEAKYNGRLVRLFGCDVTFKDNKKEGAYILSPMLDLEALEGYACVVAAIVDQQGNIQKFVTRMWNMSEVKSIIMDYPTENIVENDVPNTPATTEDFVDYTKNGGNPA